MDIWRTVFVVSCLVISTRSSSIVMDYALKKMDRLGVELQPKLLENSFFNKVDTCMENGNITSSSMSSGCIGSLIELIYPFKKFTVKPYPYPDQLMSYLQRNELGMMLDSWGKLPDGVFEGNVQWLGSYQQCNRLQNAKYCLVGVSLDQFSLSIPYIILLGTCVPKKCNDGDIMTLLRMIDKETKVKVSYTFQICDEPHEYSKGNIIAIFFILSLIITSVIGAIVELSICKTEFQIDGMITSREDSTENKDLGRGADDMAKTYQQNNSDVVENCASSVITETNYTASTITTKAKTDPGTSLKKDTEDPYNQNGRLAGFFLCFSLVRNIKIMTSTKVAKDSIECLNGLRFLMTCLITAGHTGLIVYKSDPLQFRKTFKRFWFMPVSNSPEFVDIFFLMSGCLVSYLTLKWLDKKKNLKFKDILYMYFHRYIRLTPSLAMSIIFATYVLPVIESGPLAMYAERIENRTENCEKYWWTNLLYIQNVYPNSSDICINSTWYLAVDMQLYIFSPLVVVLMVYVERRSLKRILGPFIVTLILVIISFIIRAYYIYRYNFPTVALFSASPTQMRAKDYDGYWDAIYVTLHGRYGPYVVGMFLGYVIARKMTISSNKWRFLIVTIGWLLSIVVGFLSYFGPYKAFKIREFSDNEHLIYGTFHGVGLAASFAWLIYACHNNMGGIINTFLSWRAWIPLSRISYGAYLFHPLVCDYYYRIQQDHHRLQENLAWILLAGIVPVSYLLGAMNSVFLEIPVANLEKKLLSR